jgi:hypothetical protein
MRLAMTLALLGAAAPALAGAPLALGERQVVSLEFQQPVARISTTDPDLLQVHVAGTKVSVIAARGGRASLEIAFADGATVTYDVTVEGVRRPAARTPAAAPGPNELALAVGEEGRFRSPGLSRVLLEENGVARVTVQGETVSVIALARGDASLVVVDGAGAKRAWQIRVR